jgi:hypothetical protein
VAQLSAKLSFVSEAGDRVSPPCLCTLLSIQVFSFGEERVIGPSDWLNMGRTFDAVRVDLHHPGFRISMFASSVIVGQDGVIDHLIQGNNLHGVYGSLTNVIPHATLEPYVLWRLAPDNAGLPETAGRGHLNKAQWVFVWLIGFRRHSIMASKWISRRARSDPTRCMPGRGYWNVGRTFRKVRAKPRAFIESN